MRNNDFDRFDKSFNRTFSKMAIITIVLNLVFWLGLTGGALALLKYFSII